MEVGVPNLVNPAARIKVLRAATGPREAGQPGQLLSDAYAEASSATDDDAEEIH